MGFFGATASRSSSHSWIAMLPHRLGFCLFIFWSQWDVIPLCLLSFSFFDSSTFALTAVPHKKLARRLRRSHPFSSDHTTRPLIMFGSSPRKPFFDEKNDNHPGDREQEPQRQRSDIAAAMDVDRPTETRSEGIGPDILPAQPKIVVLGATGKIGRWVVRQLLEQSHLDATIVAFCRDYDKACRVLYDDWLVAHRTAPGKQQRGRGPKLQIVQGDLVPPEELPGYHRHSKFDYRKLFGTAKKHDSIEHLDEEELDWIRRAKSTASFYGTSITDYDNRHEQPPPNEALQDAIRGCTTIISCVGDVRPTHVWSDWLARPLWRLLRPDVSTWCRDPRHPYYVHYASTRKVLAMAEREQWRRQAALDEAAEIVDGDDHRHGEHEEKATNKKAAVTRSIPRIRFIRISDLCVAQEPWHFIPLITNALHSMVFRYQAMAEQLLQSSSVVETVVLRPGDLVDDERNLTTTALQVNVDGSVPHPSRVGREDVAALAVAAALFDLSQPKGKGMERHHQRHRQLANDPLSAPFHYTLAVRWVGQDMAPYPSQGNMEDGLPNANMCMQSALRKLRKRQQNKNDDASNPLQQHSNSSRVVSVHNTDRTASAVSLKTIQPRLSIKPYGLCVAIPVYLILTLVGRTFISQLWLLPIWPLWIRSWLLQVKSVMALASATVLGQIGSLLQEGFGKLLIWSKLHRMAPQYISI